MKEVMSIEYESIRGCRFKTPKGALIDDFESFASNVIVETLGNGKGIDPVMIHFLKKAAAHPARFARRLRRLHKMRQALIDYEQAEAKQPDTDAIPF